MSPKYKTILSSIILLSIMLVACVAIIVFLSSTQPFLSKKSLALIPLLPPLPPLPLAKFKDGKIGHIVGGLGFIDELTAMIVAPLLGALNDNLNSKQYNGSKLIQSFSFIIIAISLFGYAVWCKNLVQICLYFEVYLPLG